jgi:hypothetical protein
MTTIQTPTTIHADEYRRGVERMQTNNTNNLIQRWKLGRLFLKYGESQRTISEASGVHQTYVSRHMLIARVITDEAMLRDVIEQEQFEGFAGLVRWAQIQRGPVATTVQPAQRRIPRTISVRWPAATVSAVVDWGLDPESTLANLGSILTVDELRALLKKHGLLTPATLRRSA